ncbi:hypothetical protein Fmac_013903 [Flemingia macrophylla]|uniref:Uncharacterized protein n=1 Tax=Flemingia macrophylla TaxID=520843 RepID=A0ABD1MC75_9FABA
MSPSYLPLRWESTGEQWWYASPIDCAAANGHYDLVVELLHLDANLLIKLTSLRRIRRLETVWDHGDQDQARAVAKHRSRVVRNLLASSDVVNLTDAQGNTALHVASYGGHLPVVDILILASSSLALLTNHYGDTFLHMAVAGFKSPGFRRLDKHIELMKQLVSGKIVNLEDIINVKNHDGRTALHVSVMDNVQCELVELLMLVSSIDLNICDVNGMTPLDLLKQRPRSASSDILIKRIVSAGGVSNCKDAVAGNPLNKGYVIGGSPGTSFRIPDAEIFLYTGIENSSDANYEYDQASVESYSCSNEPSNSDSANSPRNMKSISVDSAARLSKFRLRWPKRRETKSTASEIEDDHSLDPFSSSRNLEEFPISLRQRYSQPCSLPNNKRTSLPSPSSKVKFTSGLMQGVIQLKPHPSPFEELSVASLSSIKKQKGADIIGPSCSNRSIDDGTLLLNYKQCSFNKKLMNGYFSFGAHGLAVEDSNSCAKSNTSYKRLSSFVA